MIKATKIINVPGTYKKERYLVVAKGGQQGEILITDKNRSELFKKKAAQDQNMSHQFSSMKDDSHYLDTEPFIFEECTFIFIEFDNIEIDPVIFPSVFLVETERRIEFTDCSFIGIRKNDIGNTKTITKFVAFSSFPPNHNLKFEHCYFRSLKSAYESDKRAVSVEVKGCSFENLRNVAISAYNPNSLIVTKNEFFNVMEYSIEVVLDNAFEQILKHTDSMALSGSLENTVLIKENSIITCFQGIVFTSPKVASIQNPVGIVVEENKITNVSKNGMTFENIYTTSIDVINNQINSGGFAGAIFINTKAKYPINFQDNSLFANEKLGLCVENAIIQITGCRFSKSVTGLWINFGGFENFTKEMETRILFKNSTEMMNRGVESTGQSATEVMNTQHLLLLTNKITLVGNSFSDIKKYGVIVASNQGGIIKASKNSFMDMQAGFCLKETCKGTISKKLKEKLSDFFDDDSSFRSGLLAGAGGEKGQSNVIVLPKRGQILIEGNTYEKCQENIRKRTVTSDLFVRD